MPRLAGPGQRVPAAADVAVVLVEGYSQRLHGLRMVVMVIVVVSVKLQRRSLWHGEGVGQGEGDGAGRGPVVGRGGAQLGRPQADVYGLVGGGEGGVGGVGAQRVDVHLGHLIHAAAAARCQTTSCWPRLV